MDAEDAGLVSPHGLMIVGPVPAARIRGCRDGSQRVPPEYIDGDRRDETSCAGRAATRFGFMGMDIPKRQSLLALSLAWWAVPATAFAVDGFIVLDVRTPESRAQQVYVDVLGTELHSAGFLVQIGRAQASNGRQLDSPLERGLVAGALENVIAISFLHDVVSDGGALAALLSLPGGFVDPAEHRHAVRGIFGDYARDEILEDGLLALRMWVHSTEALVSKGDWGSVKDFEGARIAAPPDRATRSFLERFGAERLEIAAIAGAAPSLHGLRDGEYDGAIIPHDHLDAAGVSRASGVSVVLEFRHRTAVALTSEEWWESLSVRAQEAIALALEEAEKSAWNALDEQHRRTRSLIDQLDAASASWEAPNDRQLRDAIHVFVAVDDGDVTSAFRLRELVFEMSSSGNFRRERK